MCCESCSCLCVKSPVRAKTKVKGSIDIILGVNQVQSKGSFTLWMFAGLKTGAV